MIETNGSATSVEPIVASIWPKSCGWAVPFGALGCSSVEKGGGPSGGKPARIGPVTANGAGEPSAISAYAITEPTKTARALRASEM